MIKMNVRKIAGAYGAYVVIVPACEATGLKEQVSYTFTEKQLKKLVSDLNYQTLIYGPQNEPKES